LSDFSDNTGSHRVALLDIYRTALNAVDGTACVRRQLLGRPLSGRVWAVAVGKAAAAMLAGARSVSGVALERALLITKYGHTAGPWPPSYQVIEAGHPVPDAGSLRAGQSLLDFIAAAPPDVRFLFLISGGASSLVEALPVGMTLEDLQRVNAWLLASGWPIAQMNAVRRRLSRIKGGRLLGHLAGREARALLISDVPGDAPAVIGSGLLFPAPDVERLDPQCVPAWLRPWLDNPALLKPGAEVRPQVEAEIIANLDQALAAAADRAEALGYPVHRDAVRLDGDAAAAGRRIAATLLAGAPGVYLWGGECTVQLPEQPGQGGRCQHLALAAAEVLSGHEGIALLAAGTDGSDGPGDAAGACVDGETLARGGQEGLNASTALRQADAGRFLEAAGDLIDTGPTGTNVTDLVVGLKAARN
jgi:hydroxypyruvate reductase